MAEIKVMLVEDNAELRSAFRAYMEKQEGMKVVAECGNGAEALGQMEKLAPDVVVTDIIMPQMDGYTLLEEMRSRYADKAPRTVVVSALGREDLILRAMELGARYYMIKPVEPGVLCRRVRECMGTQGGVREGSFRLTVPGHVPSTDEKLASLFLTIGIPAHIKGYAFLREAVKMVVDNPDVINRITKELYPGVAGRFGTSASKVERAIRHAIEVAWSRGRIDTLNKAFGCRVACPEDKPTNGELISMIAERIRLDQDKAS